MSEEKEVKYRDLKENLEFYQRQCDILKHEVFLLKKTIQKAIGYINFKIPPEITLETEKQTLIHWSDKYKKFAGLRSQLLKVTLDLIYLTNKPVHQDKIISTFKRRYPKTYSRITSPGETLPRRLRELAQEEWLVRPEQGYYFIGPKSLEGGTNNSQMSTVQNL